ncbi:thyroid transcription factor 1-associated protein 26 homolog [Phymastichus coffea]|uniref:thyroid transcription factor 1-associated protein 26 homolog n=1 Tax=Phymastichus coffea TaxID=108790 RepID=UPI00273B1872|nr:thyroid transcription factor 1-associated protein 26 homolog [Phymastichus coffea]
MGPISKKNPSSNKNLKHEDSQQNGKKPFNKKKYREQKYSNKYKVKQWEQKRKKTLLTRLYKDLERDEKAAKSSLKNSDPSNNASESVNNRSRNAFFSAKKEFLKKQEEKQRKIENILKAKKEKEEALKKYKEKKMKNFKVLSMKTKKGQPVMAGRMELLLEKIKNST